MVAAYLVGEQGTPRHAIILGLIVTLTHTSTAFAVRPFAAICLASVGSGRRFNPSSASAGRALVAFIGLWLLH